MSTWYAVSSSPGLHRGRLMPVRLLDQEMVLWRASEGAVHAWEDRCPHRGMRLSRGFVRGNQLSCVYHGWQYSPTGSCEKIPALPDFSPPDSICVKTFPVFEQSGVIWVTAGKGDGARPPEPLPGAKYCRSIYIRTDVKTVQEAMRTAIFPMIHRGEEVLANLIPASADILEEQPESKSYNVEWCPANNSGTVLGGGASDKKHEFATKIVRVSYQSQLLEGNSIVISASSPDMGSQTLLLLLQPVSEKETGIHLFAASDDGYEVFSAHFFSNWIERVRWYFENSEENSNDRCKPWVESCPPSASQ